MIAVIDYGAGNLQSVCKALQYIGCESCVVDSREALFRADGAILPGVGSFADAMDCLEQSGMKEAILAYLQLGRPFLGICLGLQLLFEGSEESPGVKGLGVFKGSMAPVSYTHLDVYKRQLLRGICYRMKEQGYTIGGFDAYISSEIPQRCV